VLIAEHFLLICLDTDRGRPRTRRPGADIRQLIAAALLLDLASQQRAWMQGTQLRIEAALPLTHPILARAQQLVADGQDSAPAAIATIARRMPGLSEQLLDGLFRRDVLHRITQRRWLLFSTTRYPLRSLQARNEAVERVRAAAHSAGKIDLHGTALLILADAAGLLLRLLDAHDYERAEQRLLALGEYDATMSDGERCLVAVRRVLIA
jgi:Golgi phosphoprotein 3 (GPP34)